MTETTARFLNLFFEPGETISVSPNKYGYHSIEQSDVAGDITLISPKEDLAPVVISEKDINLIAINPVNGWRRDENVTKFRSFLVEIDTGTLEEQKQYIKESKMPYSVCVFSGNKSLHFGIVLDEPLPSISMWRFYNQWLLNTLPKTDQQLKNPTRCIRFPGNRRANGKQLIQALVEMNGRVKQEDFFRWLFEHEDKKPVSRKRMLTDDDIFPGMPDFDKLPKDVKEHLANGVTSSRNATWFYIACRMAEKGFSFNQTMSYLEGKFQEETDFPRREWENCLKSAFKRVNGDSYV